MNPNANIVMSLVMLFSTMSDKAYLLKGFPAQSDADVAAEQPVSQKKERVKQDALTRLYEVQPVCADRATLNHALALRQAEGILDDILVKSAYEAVNMRRKMQGTLWCDEIPQSFTRPE